MQQLKLIIPAELVNQRIDKAVTQLCSDISRSQIQKSIKSQNLTLNKVIISNLSTKVKENDEIVVTLTEQVSEGILPADIKLDIVFEDDDLIVVNKPVGMVVHPGAGKYQDTLVNALLFHTNSLSDIGGAIRPGIVHRLDIDTSGLMLVAKNNKTHVHLAEQIRTRQLIRRYKALVWGVIKPPSGIINVNIGRSKIDRKKMATFKVGGRESITHYKTLELFQSGLFSLAECQLKTGRTHQIRVHLSHVGHSIVGDKTYGHNHRKIMGTPESLQDMLLDFNHQALHSFYISFIHPATGQVLVFEKEPPDCYNNLIAFLRKTH